jgi:hypothetical protein
MPARRRPSERPSSGNPHRGRGQYLACEGSFQYPRMEGHVTERWLRLNPRAPVPCRVCGRLIHFEARTLKVCRHSSPGVLRNQREWLATRRPKLVSRKKIAPK